MKKLLTILLLLTCGICSGQTNLVTNPSFETYSHCPDYISQIYRATGWYVTRNSPDYFNVCSTDTFPSGQHIVNVPLNWAGYRTPASGNAYAGVITSWQSSEEREHLGSQLITPLQIGTKYYASFKVSLGGEANPFTYCGTNKLGILFSTFQYDSLTQTPICSNCAQIYSNTIVTDTLNWTKITGSFVADSNYSYISIGRFNLNALTNFTQLSGIGYNAYYYIDDVCISDDSAYTYNYVYTGIENITENYSVNSFPNPFNDKLTFQTTHNDKTELYLYDLLSRKLLQHSFTNSTTLNTEQLAKGIYIYELRNKNGIIKNGKVIKQ